MQVTVSGSVVRESNGRVLLDIPSKDLTPEENKLLSDLFPHTFDKVEEALMIECLLDNARPNDHTKDEFLPPGNDLPKRKEKSKSY